MLPPLGSHRTATPTVWAFSAVLHSHFTGWVADSSTEKTDGLQHA